MINTATSFCHASANDDGIYCLIRVHYIGNFDFEPSFPLKKGYA